MSDLVAVTPAAAGPLAQVHASAFDRPWGEDDLAAMMAGLGAQTLAAIDAAGGVLGFVLFQSIAGEGEILTIAVAPHARRQGVGRRLVEAAAEAAARTGAESLWLDVAADNVAGLALYAAAGFEQQGRRRDYYRAGPNQTIDAIVMRRVLNSGDASRYSP